MQAEGEGAAKRLRTKGEGGCGGGGVPQGEGWYMGGISYYLMVWRRACARHWQGGR